MFKDFYDYLQENHGPSGNAMRFVSVETLLEETDYTREEIFNFLVEGRAKNLLFPTWVSSTGKYSFDERTPEDLESIGVWNKLYQETRYKKKPDLLSK